MKENTFQIFGAIDIMCNINGLSKYIHVIVITNVFSFFFFPPSNWTTFRSFALVHVQKLRPLSPTFSLLSCSGAGEVGDLTLLTATVWATVTPPPGAGLLFSTVSTLMSRCFGDTYLISGEVLEVVPKEMFAPVL